MAVEFSIDPTPNPNALKFTASKAILEGRLSYRTGDNPEEPVAKGLLEIDGVESIFGFQDFITINKTPDSDWDTIIPHVQEVFDNNF